LPLDGGNKGTTMAARFSTAVLLAYSAASAAAGSHQSGPLITQNELIRRTQEIYDAVASGDRRPFEKYFAADSMIFDERGHSMDKTAFVAQQSPLPTGYSGAIALVRPQSRILGGTAVLSYDLDENEAVFGQALKARYHATDTWIRRDGEWQIVAEQLFRYYEDPAPSAPDLNHYPDYSGSYELAPGVTRSIFIDDTGLILQRTGKPNEHLLQETPDVFFRKGIEGRLIFRRDETGQVDALIDRRNNEDLIWLRFPVGPVPPP
jgi:hypothetical protein